MDLLLSQLRRNNLAVFVFAIYALGWLAVAFLSASGRDSTTLHGCGRGTLMVYPLLYGGAASLFYWLGILLTAVFSQQNRSFLFALLVAAVLWPVLLVAIL
ncbi:hypothetical protein LGH70_11775 [Hymenobacter sp. BT635]|uniref:Uncharacterized protein n=1 Tax=Hymenobacter nitidus TaxID=2880929 RepID=A0ABS8AEX0_9BACT|nr:hypothetical protein [Hymenobacter nitidus]MCB2378267.1 hypothetical protein [Hymenobacter nitidus]